MTDGGAPERARAGLAGGTQSGSADDRSSREAGERSRRTHHTDAPASGPPPGVRCALCHEGLADAAPVPCAGCATLLHADCAASLGYCPTLGCARGRPPLPSDERPPSDKSISAGAIYGPDLVFLASLLASFGGGGALMALNAWRLGRRALAAGIFAAGVAATALLALLGSFVPEDSLAASRGMAVAVAIVARQVAVLAQGRAYGEHLRLGGRRGRWWGALAVSVVVGVLVLLPVAVAVFVARFGVEALTAPE